MFRQGTFPSKVAAVLLLCAVPVILVSGTVLPSLDYYQAKQVELTMKREKTRRLIRAAQALPDLKVQLNKLNSESSSRSAFLQATEAPLAVAEIQGITRKIITRFQGEFIGSQNVKSTTKELFEPVVLRIETQINASGLTQLLYQLETQQPSLFIDNVTIRPLRTSTLSTSRNRRQRKDTGQQLSVQFDITGYLWTQES